MLTEYLPYIILAVLSAVYIRKIIRGHLLKYYTSTEVSEKLKNGNAVPRHNRFHKRGGWIRAVASALGHLTHLRGNEIIHYRLKKRKSGQMYVEVRVVHRKGEQVEIVPTKHYIRCRVVSDNLLRARRMHNGRRRKLKPCKGPPPDHLRLLTMST